ncbi:MAG: type 1 glutamine amidotransferase domain-containing protein [Bacteroidetes bacterium]|nr:type 1 glutamine amidotransferase domain-containing protein [Bacteroidota bacterium]
MKRIFHFLLAVILTGNFAMHAQDKKKPENKLTHQKMKAMKILFVLTSHSELGTTGEKTGLWIEEFATPYYFFTDKGIDVTIASPKGGQPPIDPKSNLPDYSTVATKRFYADKTTMDKLSKTLKLSEVNQKDYDAIFYPGGHGPMWDLAEDKQSIQLIESFYSNNKPIALVCHGPAALKHVKDKSGMPLVKGKKVTAFTNTEEEAVQLTKVVPFSLEDMLKANGANYVKGNDWGSFAVADGLLITGQNPASSELVAEKLIGVLSESISK